METHIQATEDSLIDTLSFKLPNTANFITDRRSVSFFPSGSNDYGPRGVKIMKFMLTGTDWLDPSTVRVQFRLNNKDTTKNLHPLNPLPATCFRRLRILRGGIVVEEIDFYRHHEDPLWRTSFDRFFYIDAFIRENKIENVVHFDNDVLLYHDVNDILTDLRNDITNIGLTRHKESEFVCGFMYIKHYNNLLQICDKLLELAKINIIELERILGSMPHEMRLLGYINETNADLITTLPGLPEPLQQNNYGVVFDPSTYGQFLGGSGTAAANTVHPNNIERIIDRYIVDGIIKPTYSIEDNKPYIFVNDKKIPIFNLHVHSKQLSNFCKF
jgi:hypothetical protein